MTQLVQKHKFYSTKRVCEWMIDISKLLIQKLTIIGFFINGIIATRWRMKNEREEERL